MDTSATRLYGPAEKAERGKYEDVPKQGHLEPVLRQSKQVHVVQVATLGNCCSG